MMNIKLAVQARHENMIDYEISENIITATINGITDTFDFTDLPDGELQLYDEGNSLIETTLDEVPILSARKENGVLTVHILFSVDVSEQDERILFPKPMNVAEFNELMNELVERDKLEENESVDDSLEETDDLDKPDEVVDDDIIVEDDYIIDIEEVDF